jgi:hypothetical protein
MFPLSKPLSVEVDHPEGLVLGIHSEGWLMTLLDLTPASGGIFNLALSYEEREEYPLPSEGRV